MGQHNLYELAIATGWILVFHVFTYTLSVQQGWEEIRW